MRVLGVHDGHNAAAALVVDGAIVGAVQEERFTREKNWSGVPRRAIEWVLQEGGLTPADVDVVAMNGAQMPAPKNREQLLEEYRAVDSMGVRARRIAGAVGPVRSAYDRRRREQRTREIAAAGLPTEGMRFVDHHHAHAAAAYYGWGTYDEPVLVLTNDGAGDGLCATVSVGRDGKLERIAAVPEAESIGNVYAVVTFLLGMVPLEHEYKLMGLAPYASPSAAQAVYEDLEGLMRVDGMTWARARRFPPTYYSYSALRELFEYRRFDAICAGLQLWVEKMFVEWVSNCVRETGIRKLALSGGTFMNVKVNKLLGELPDVDDLFVFPSCGDESNSMGAAYAVEAELGNAHIPALRDLYLGPEASDEEIQRALPAGLTSYRPDDIDREVAELLARGEIVGRFAGRAEFGARALGNRSILADASRPDAVRVINDMIKSRDFWMPFAPAILDERASDYLINPKNLASPYMILSFDTTDRRGDLQAAIHASDFTARPEVVYEDWNPSFHRVLKQYEARTGRGGLLNTSFNLHGFPIVNSPEDAVDVLERSGLQHLALGPYLVTKAEAAARAA
jgi:carbamoyltransferase